MCCCWAPQPLAAFAFPAPCDNRQHGLTLLCCCLVPLGDGRQCPCPHPIHIHGHAWVHPTYFQRSKSTAQAKSFGEDDEMELGGLEASGPRRRSDANPHRCCQRSCFDDESSIALPQAAVDPLPPSPILQWDLRSSVEGILVAATHQGCPQ